MIVNDQVFLVFTWPIPTLSTWIKVPGKIDNDTEKENRKQDLDEPQAWTHRRLPAVVRVWPTDCGVPGNEMLRQPGVFE